LEPNKGGMLKTRFSQETPLRPNRDQSYLDHIWKRYVENSVFSEKLLALKKRWVSQNLKTTKRNHPCEKSIVN